MEFYGLLGEKLGHSLSPKIHKQILQSIEVEGGYKLFQVPKDKLQDFVAGVKLLEIKGFNITIPYKEDIMKELDFISQEAQKIGAVNTVTLKENKLYGYNTDYFGFGATLEKEGVILEGKIAVILGAGGACKAAATYLLDNGVSKLYIVSRQSKAVNIDINDRRAEVISYEELKYINGEIIINSTPVGMYPKIGVSPVDIDIINNFNYAMDLIYNPLETEFLRLAKEAGKLPLGGLYMLVGQAVKAQEIFQNQKIDDIIIDNIYKQIKGEFK